MKKFVSKIALAGGLMTIAMATAPMAFAAEDIKIGVLVPTSGSSADTGLPIANGVKLATAEINANGGVDGRMIKLFLRDTQGKPEVASAAAKELIAREGVKLFVGAALSGESLAVSELGKQEKAVIFNPSAGAKQLTEDYFHRYIFQQAPTTDDAAQRDIDIIKKIGSKKICMVGFDYAYSHDLFPAIKNGLEGSGITVTNQYLLKLGTTDYSTLITQLMSDDCDTIMGALFGGGFIAFANQAQPFGLFKTKKHVVWEANLGQPEMAAALKGAYPEGMWTNAVDLWYFKGSEALQKYHQGLAKLEGTEQTSMWAISGYNATRFLAEAVKKAGSSDPEAVVTALEGLTIDSPLGSLTVDPKTHRVRAPTFYGPMVTTPGSDVKRMSPATLVR